MSRVLNFKKLTSLLLALIVAVSMIMPSVLSPKEAGAKPQTITGRCYVKLVKYTSPYEGGGGPPTEFDVTMPDDKVLRGYCMDEGLSVQIDGWYDFTGTLNASGTYDIEVHTGGLVPWERVHPLAKKDTFDDGVGKPQYCQRVGKFTWVPPEGKAKLKKVTKNNKSLTDLCPE